MCRHLPVVLRFTHYEPPPLLPQAATGVVGHIPAALRSAAVFYYVNVTNTGSVDSDEVVLGFLVPPGNGTDGVPLQVRGQL